MKYDGKRAVYIDDNKVMLKVVKGKLEKLGFMVDIGEDANTLFCLLKNNEYDIIILDDMMPEITGTEAMQKLKGEGYTKPIVVLTGNIEPTDKEKYLSAGFDEYIGKPPTDGELDKVFTLLLDRIL